MYKLLLSYVNKIVYCIINYYEIGQIIIQQTIIFSHHHFFI